MSPGAHRAPSSRWHAEQPPLVVIQTLCWKYSLGLPFELWLVIYHAEPGSGDHDKLAQLGM